MNKMDRSAMSPARSVSYRMYGGSSRLYRNSLTTSRVRANFVGGHSSKRLSVPKFIAKPLALAGTGHVSQPSN